MKILLAESMSYFELGGAAKACRGLLEALAERGHSCALVSIEKRHELAARGFNISSAKGVIECERRGIKIFAAESAQDQWRPMLHCLRTFDPDWTLVGAADA